MTHDEKVEALKLTPEQLKAFNKFKKAHEACLKLGIQFIGFDESQYAVNGTNVLNHRDYYLEHIDDDEIEFNSLELDAPQIIMDEPYIDATVAIKVKSQE